MAKKSRKHSMRPDNNTNGGCMWGLVSLLDFRHPRYSPKLLLDRKHGSSRFSSDQKYTNEKGGSQLNHAEKQKLMDYAGNSNSENGDPSRSIRLFMEDEISKLQPAHKKIGLSGKGVSSAENSMQAVVAPNITFRPENDDLRITTYSEPSKPGFQDVLERFSINLNLVALLQEFYSDKVGGLHVNSERDNVEQYPFMRIDRSKLDNGYSESTRQTVQSQYVLRQTLNEILEVFLCDKINDLKRSGCTGLLGQSEQSNDALDVIALNKELFLRFLQDPNSHLAKYIQALQISHSKKLLSSDSCKVLEDIKLLGNDCGNQHASSSSSKQLWIQNIFKKKDNNVKSLTEGDYSQARSRIVVLKPIPSRTESLPDASSFHSPHNLRASGQSEPAAFHFSFHQIKRKLKQAIARKKEQHISSSKKEPHLSSVDKIQQRKLHGSYSEDSTKRIPVNGMYLNSKVVSSYDNALTQTSSETTPNLENTLMPNTKKVGNMDRESNLQREARKHIIEMFNFGYDGFHPPTKKVSKTLEKFIYSQECNLSPRSSPGKHRNRGLSPGETILSPVHAPTSQNDTKQFSTEKCDLGLSPKIDKKLIGISYLHDLNLKGDTPNAEKVLSCSEESTPKGFKDGIKSSDVEVLMDVGCINLTSVDTNSGTACMTLKVDDDLSHPHLRLGVIEVDQQILTPLAPPGVLLVKHVEAPEYFTEKPKQPSPVSVLDTSCLDDCDGCRSTEIVKTEPDELPVSPRNLQYEEENDEVILITDETATQSCTDEDLRFEYVRSLLEASGLASRESWWRWHSSHRLLQPSLYNQVETASGDVLDDLPLLFNCVNEVLEEIRSRYCTRMPWVLFVQPMIRPFPLDEDLIEEVWKGIKNINSSLLINGTLDQIVGRDLETATWVDIRPQLSDIGVALEDEIWEDILEETMLALWE